MLVFQQAKRAVEQALIEAGRTCSIVRATAWFTSLSGQVKRVAAGNSLLVLGDDTLTFCTLSSDDDLAAFIVECHIDLARQVGTEAKVALEFCDGDAAATVSAAVTRELREEFSALDGWLQHS